MKEKIDKKLEECYNKIFERPLSILNQFNDYYGERYVDMQIPCNVTEFKDRFKARRLNYIFTANDLKLDEDEYKHTYKNIYDFEKEEEYILDTILANISNTSNINLITNALSIGTINLLIYFPTVRITNENDRYVDITDLYVKIRVRYDGTIAGSFTMNRSSYNYIQIANNYMHSHISDIPFHDFTSFRSPCLGSGPINDTICNLSRSYDLDIWGLLCLEIDKYVHVESIAGTPYHRLENIGNINRGNGINDYSDINYLPRFNSGVLSISKTKEFTTHLIESNILTYNFINGSYSLGMSFVDVVLHVSNLFIDWYNKSYREKQTTASLQDLCNSGVIRKCFIIDNKIYYESNRTPDNYTQYQGKEVCIFKGEQVVLNIYDLKNIDTTNYVYIMNIDCISYITSTILKIINYRYGKTATSQEDNRIGEEVRYF